MPSFRILSGDNLESLKTLEDNSVDSIVTDPPYGLKFMGKRWDYDVPTVALWEECLRVLKPGGHLLAFSGTRTYHRMVVRIEDAGFEIRDMISWVYGSGFPKNLDISKAIDKIQGVVSEMEKGISHYLKEQRERKGLTRGEVDSIIYGGSTRYHFCEGRTDSKGEFKIYLPSIEKWGQLKTLLDLDDTYDDYIKNVVPKEENRNKIDGGKSHLPEISEGDFGYQKDEIRWKKDRRVTTASSEAGLQWEGWGTALKPAQEPIVLARKPLEGTVAANVLEYGTGGLNIEECRIPYEKGGDAASNPLERANRGCKTHFGDGFFGEAGDGFTAKISGKGRWPANFIHDGSEEVLELFPSTKSVASKTKHDAYSGTSNTTFLRGKSGSENQRDDSGSAARFFYCAKTSQKDRDEGIENFKEKPSYMVENGSRTSSLGGERYERHTTHRNNHPTVKPTDLMRYLCRLITPPKGIVLDPFMGSGSTGKAAILEGFNFVGMEIDPDYVAIAQARLNHANAKGVENEQDLTVEEIQEALEKLTRKP